MHRKNVFAVLLILALSGCATLGSLTRKNEHKFETTGLFSKSCKEQKEIVCKQADITEMISAFNSIKESDKENKILGDSIDEVKNKGFTIYLDNEEKKQRPGTQIIYGADALTAVGMPLNPPQLNTPEEIETYKKYMKAHFAWTFKETDIEGVTDRIYINTKNASVMGPNYVFVITFQNGNVFRRVIKGGPQDTITQERAFLLGPGSFIGGIFKSGADKAIDLVK